jgi:ABC-type glycerol-3-phosphate transport system permease component
VLRSLIFYTLLVLFVSLTLTPIYVMLATSFLAGGSLEHIFQPFHHPGQWTFSNYRDLWESGPFAQYFWNSFFVASLVTLGNVFLSSMVAYALVWYRFPYRQSLLFLILCSMMLPAEALMIPLYQFMSFCGLLDTYFALIAPQFLLPLNIFLMKHYFEKIPLEIRSAAQLDGASELRIFWTMILPVSLPMLAIIAVNTFMHSWNSFLYPFLFTRTAEMRTLSVGLAHYRGLYEIDPMHLMAGASLSAVPVLCVFFCCQRWILAGVLQGSVKG